MSYVYYCQRQLFLRPEVMGALKLRRRQSVSEDVLWRAMDLNAAAMRGTHEAAGGPGAPFGPAFEATVSVLEDAVAAYYAEKDKA